MTGSPWPSPVALAGRRLVRFDPHVIDGVMCEILTAFHAVPRRGAEAGGILLGRPSGEDMLVVDFKPALSEHRFGPSYLLSETDMRGLEESLDSFRHSGHGGLEVLGFYRSQTRMEASAADGDAELMRRFFREPGRLFLLLTPHRGQAIAAELFMLDGEALRPAAAPATFPPEAAGIPLHGPEIPAPEAQPPASREEALPESPETFSPVDSGAAAQTPPPAEQRQLPAISSTLPGRGVPETSGERAQRRWPVAVAALTVCGLLLGYRSVATKRAAPPTRPRVSAPAIPNAARATPAALIAGQPSPPADAPARHVAVPDALTARAPSPVPAAGQSVPPGNAATPAKNVERDIRAAVAQWAAAVRSGNPQLVAECYASQVERYFDASNVPNDVVRRAAADSAARNGKVAVLRYSGLRVKPQSSTRAIATFRKHWQTAGPHIFAGEQQERLTFSRAGDSWKIVSDEETRIFWTQRGR